MIPLSKTIVRMTTTTRSTTQLLMIRLAALVVALVVARHPVQRLRQAEPAFRPAEDVVATDALRAGGRLEPRLAPREPSRPWVASPVLEWRLPLPATGPLAESAEAKSLPRQPIFHAVFRHVPRMERGDPPRA